MEQKEKKWYETNSDGQIAFIISKESMKEVVAMQKEVFSKRQSDPRACLASLALEEVEKTHLICLEILEFLGEDPSGWKSESEVPMMRRNMSVLLVERILFSMRKLSEILIDLINFSDSDSDDALASYFLVEGIDHFIRELKNCEDFFGVKPLILQERIQDYARKLNNCITSVPEEKRWFINMKNFKNGEPKPFLSKPIHQRQMHAINRATSAEQIRIGRSYETLLSRCDSISHFNVNYQTRIEYTGRDIMVHLIQMAFFESHIMTRCEKLIRRPSSKTTVDIEDLLKKTNQKELIHEGYFGNYKPGDKVMTTFGYSGVVKEIKIGKNGHTILRVNYDQTNTAIKEDDVPARFIL